MKRFLRVTMGILLLALSVAATQIPAESLCAAADQSEFQLDGTTLVKYTGTATAVSVPAEVTKIGEEAFRANQTLKSVKLPKNLETIGNGAFSYCSVLQQVNIPDSVKEIGAGAFSCCTSLSSLNLGSGVEKLGSGILAGCSTLQSVKVDKKNKSFTADNGNLYDRDMTCLYQYAIGKTADSYRLPDFVKKIDKYAFWGCRNLNTVELNSNITAIPGYAFSNCTSLENIRIPYSVKSIDAKAFEDCINLKEVSLPASVTRIHDTAFDGCTHLILAGEAGSTAEAYANDFNQREKVVQAEYEDLSDHNRTEDQQIPVNPAEDNGQDITAAGNTEDPSKETDHANWDGRMLGSAVIRGNQAVVYIDNAVAQVKSGEALSDLTDPEAEDSAETLGESSGADEKGLYLPKYTITVQGDLADQAYYRNKDMTEYTIPSTVTRIGEFAFARSGLTSIVIPEGVKEIGYGAFYHCGQLTQIQFPDSLEIIEPEAFAKTGYLDNYRKNQASSFPFLIVGNGILLDYAGSDKKIEIPEGVIYIAPNVFKGHTEITSVLLPDTLKTIGEGAFEQCTALTQVQGGGNVKKIQDRAFAGCPLETVRIPDQVESLGLGAFDLTESSVRQDARVAVFHGNVPVVTHEKSAERLSNESYRIRALNGVSYAVVDAAVSVDSLKGTVLDPEQFGFQGVILSIASDTDRTVQLKGSTLTEEEAAALQLPSTIEIYGRQYRILNPEALQKLSQEGSQQKQAQESSLQEAGTVRVSGNTENIPVSQVRATIGDMTHAYTLDIRESEGGSGRMKDAYAKAFRTDPPTDLTACELTLTEQESGVPISRLGKDAVRISMPVPERCRDGKLFILCTDEDGQLENVSYVLEETASGQIITFETSHFSDFAFFTTGASLYAEGNVSNGKVNITQFSTKDASPDTGDYLSPKWILSAGLFFTALAVLFYRRRPKNKIIEK